MPFVNIKLIEGVLSDSQKQEIITKVTDAMVDIEGENLRPVTWVVLEEVKSGEDINLRKETLSDTGNSKDNNASQIQP